MAVNKVIYAGNTLVDLTDATASASDIASGKTAYGANGAKITGTAEGGMVTSEDVANATGTTCAISGDEVEVEPLTVTANGTYTASGVDGYTPVTVNVPTGTARTASDVTASGATVTVPAGLYSSQVQKTVDSGRVNYWDTSVVTTATEKKYTITPNFTAGYMTAVPSRTITLTLQSETVTPSETAQTITPDDSYAYINSVTVEAISSTYVGSGITQRDSTDLTASGATVTVPAGYYASQATKSVSSGTAGTPTATKGTVSNHSVSVTPSVTNTTGYITGSTKTGTAVTVAASELVSGTYTISASGTHDVTNYASASVAAGSVTASATKGTVSNHSISVTPSVTKTAGYITAGTANGTAVTVQASELVSGTLSVTENGTADVTNYASVEVNVSGGGGSGPTVVIGTFTGTATGAMNVPLDYSGNGYPIAATIYPTDGGPYDSTSDYYATVSRSAVFKWSFTKSAIDLAPQYDASSGQQNYGVASASYKSSTSAGSTSYSSGANATQYVYGTSAATNTNYGCAKFTSSSNLSVYIGQANTYGFLKNVEHTYIIVYSE